MLNSRILLLIQMCIMINLVVSTKTIEEQIQIHKKWLQRRTAIKSLNYNNTKQQTSFNRRIIKFPDNKEIYNENQSKFNTQNKYQVDKLWNDRNTVKDIHNVYKNDNKIITTPEITTFQLLNEQKATLNSTTKLSKTQNSNDTSKWGKWSKWSICSRSCGGGIKSQLRECITKSLSHDKKQIKYMNETTKDCIGLYKRYRICNEQICPNPDVDFREEQCAQYNYQTFKGKQYVWEAYIKDDAECELNCKPVGLNYFATLQNFVIDGTECKKPVDFFKRNFTEKSLCVEGICKVVHSNGVISGTFMNNGGVRCGTLICRPISGIFTKTHLQNGYNHIATIPIGSSNISITELKHSLNFLVLKSSDQKYIINGDYIISQSGPYSYDNSGTIIDYRRIDGITNSTTPGHRKIEGVTEWITITGPTTEPLNLMVLATQINPGIKYEYLLPINQNVISSSDEDESISIEDDKLITNSEMSTKSKTSSPTNNTMKVVKRKRQFLWKVVGFNTCSKQCGGGMQTPIIRCVREQPTRIFSPKRCAHLSQPILNDALLRCNSQPCPAYWRVFDWTDCNCGSFNEELYQNRDIKCVQELGTGMIIQVNNGACVDELPLSRQKCECPKYMKTPQLEVYKHTKPAIIHTQNDLNTIRHNIHGVPRNITAKRAQIQENKKSGNWLLSDWNEQCSSECGSGIQYRTIFCDRSPPNNERCDITNTPDTSRQCSSEKKCKSGDWFVGQWSECHGDCFNLQMKRTVVCVRSKVIIDDTECEPIEKPETIKICNITDVNDCRPKWHYSDWTTCTKSCDGGSQKRHIKCLEPNVKEKFLQESDNCLYSERPLGYRKCNVHLCNLKIPTTSAIVTSTTEQYETKIDLDCTDDFSNCHLVIKAKLCNYAYYSEHCCRSCLQTKNEDILN